jgi:hypothetical protein
MGRKYRYPFLTFEIPYFESSVDKNYLTGKNRAFNFSSLKDPTGHYRGRPHIAGPISAKLRGRLTFLL